MVNNLMLLYKKDKGRAATMNDDAKDELAPLLPL